MHATILLCVLVSLLSVSPVWSQNISETNEDKNRSRVEAISLDALLDEVKTGHAADARDNRDRLREFKEAKSEQQRLLQELTEEEKRQESISHERELTFEKNEELLSDLQKRLDNRLGALRELFGVLQQVSGDAQGQFSASVTQIEFPDRVEFLKNFTQKMGQTSELPSIAEIENLWFELQREMTESGKIKRVQYPIIDREGREVEADVVRVGTFNLIADGRYLQFTPETGRVIEYARQPSSRFLAGAEKISVAEENFVPLTIDPARGQLLSLIVQAPKFSERIAQGGIIGYAIISLGIVTLIVALVRLLVLFGVEHKINVQKTKLEKIDKSNPLGRVLEEYRCNKKYDMATVELKIGEAVLREVPKVQRGLSFLKIIAAVAPLLGLLGTVTGMILTFQTITLFGAGDPKLMAGGISQALVTTVLGLCVAIPTLLLHNVLQTKAKNITDVLEQEATAIIADLAKDEVGPAKA